MNSWDLSILGILADTVMVKAGLNLYSMKMGLFDLALFNFYMEGGKCLTLFLSKANVTEITNRAREREQTNGQGFRNCKQKGRSR